MSQPAQPEAANIPPKSTSFTKNLFGQMHEQLPRLAIWLIRVVLMVIAVTVSPQVLNAQYLSTQLKQAAPLGVIAIGQTFVIVSAGIYLSIASVIATKSVMAANMMAGQICW